MHVNRFGINRAQLAAGNSQRLDSFPPMSRIPGILCSLERIISCCMTIFSATVLAGWGGNYRHKFLEYCRLSYPEHANFLTGQEQPRRNHTAKNEHLHSSGGPSLCVSIPSEFSEVMHTRPTLPSPSSCLVLFPPPMWFILAIACQTMGTLERGEKHDFSFSAWCTP